jgi:superfamily II DNA or RNA helicase
MGEFDLEEAARAFGDRAAIGDAVSHYRRRLHPGTAICFCCTIEHAEQMAAAFRSAGIRAASVSGSTPAEERKRLIAGLGTGEVEVLSSCMIISEGTDIPSVGGAILMRPTASLSLYLQMVGRALRPAPGKQEAVILDHVGNIARLGHHLEERHWTLAGVRKRERTNAPSVKTCPQCFCAMASPSPCCPECGHRFRPERRSYAVVAGELQEMSAEVLKQQRKREQLQATSLEELIALGQRRGMKNPRGWARYVLAARQTKGHWRHVA